MTEIRRALFLFPTDRMGGAERITRTLAREAAISGAFDVVECFILCRDRTGTLDALVELDNVKLHYTLASNERGGLLPMLRILSQKPYDFVFSSHTHVNAACSAMRWMGLLKTKRLVSRESTLIFSRTFKGIRRLAHCFYYLYGKQDLIVCQTDRMLDSVDTNTRHRFRDLLAVIPNLIDSERIAEGRLMSPPLAVTAIPPRRTLIAWCGRLSDVKSPGRALEVMRLLHDQGQTDAHLLFIGEGPLRTELEERAFQLGLTDFVTFTGYMANPTPAFMHCRVGLLTSDIEGFPNVILEMLAAGASGVATTDCAGGVSEIPAVRVSKDNTPAALAEAVRLVLADEVDRKDEVRDFLVSRSPSRFLAHVIGS